MKKIAFLKMKNVVNLKNSLLFVYEIRNSNWGYLGQKIKIMWHCWRRKALIYIGIRKLLQSLPTPSIGGRAVASEEEGENGTGWLLQWRWLHCWVLLLHQDNLGRWIPRTSHYFWCQFQHPHPSYPFCVSTICVIVVISCFLNSLVLFCYP